MISIILLWIFFFGLLAELFEPRNPTALPEGTRAPKDLRSVKVKTGMGYPHDGEPS